MERHMLKCNSQPDCWITSNAGPCDQCGAYCEHLVHVQLDLRLLCPSCCPCCRRPAPKPHRPALLATSRNWEGNQLL